MLENEVYDKELYANDMTGQYSHSVDAKGRVFIPVKFRDSLTRSFKIGVSADCCIRAYTTEAWCRIAAAYDRANVSNIKSKRFIYRGIHTVEMDAQGRIMLPEAMRKKAGITDKVEIIGMGTWAELWDPAKLEDNQEKVDTETINACFKELGII